nr:hypothetical protein [Micromonospora sp. DSM 115978]
PLDPDLLRDLVHSVRARLGQQAPGRDVGDEAIVKAYDAVRVARRWRLASPGMVADDVLSVLLDRPLGGLRGGGNTSSVQEPAEQGPVGRPVPGAVLELDLPAGLRSFDAADLSADDAVRLEGFAQAAAAEAVRRTGSGLPPVVVHLEAGGSGRLLDPVRAFESGDLRAHSVGTIVERLLAARPELAEVPPGMVRVEPRARGLGPGRHRRAGGAPGARRGRPARRARR